MIIITVGFSPSMLRIRCTWAKRYKIKLSSLSVNWQWPPVRGGMDKICVHGEPCRAPPSQLQSYAWRCVFYLSWSWSISPLAFPLTRRIYNPVQQQGVHEGLIDTRQGIIQLTARAHLSALHQAQWQCSLRSITRRVNGPTTADNWGAVLRALIALIAIKRATVQQRSSTASWLLHLLIMVTRTRLSRHGNCPHSDKHQL